MISMANSLIIALLWVDFHNANLISIKEYIFQISTELNISKLFVFTQPLCHECDATLGQF